MPMRNNLPTPGVVTADICTKYEEEVDETHKMEMHAEAMRNDLITNSKKDEIRMKKTRSTSYLKVDDKMQCAFKYMDDTNDTIMIEWDTGTIIRVSDGTNLRNTNATRPKLHRKGGDLEVEWLADEENGEEISYSIVDCEMYAILRG